jgi:hypothetical protein
MEANPLRVQLTGLLALMCAVTVFVALALESPDGAASGDAVSGALPGSTLRGAGASP